MPAQQPTHTVRSPIVLDKTREELRSLFSLCSHEEPQERVERLDSLHEDWFSSDDVRAIYRRMRAARSQTGEVPNFATIVADTSLPPNSHDLAVAIASSGAAPAMNSADWEGFVDLIRNNFKLTQYWRMHNEVGQKLLGLSPNIIGDMETTIKTFQASIAKHVSQRKNPVRLGQGATDNSALLESVLNPDRSGDRIKLGFREFDTRTGGLRRGHVLLAMSRFGGGKSAMALSAGVNMAKSGRHGAYISFELGDEELLERFLTNISGVDGNNIRLGGEHLSESDRARIRARYAEFNAGSGSLSLICPNTISAGGWDINDTLQVIEGCGYDFVIFDYLGLIQYHKIEGIAAPREDQILSDMARKIKVHAESHQYAAIVLHQMTEEGKIANARSIGAHVDFIWKWMISDEDRERGYVTVEQDKARGAPVYDMIFTLAFQFMQMHNVRDAPSADVSSTPGVERGSRSHAAGPTRPSPLSMDITNFR